MKGKRKKPTRQKQQLLDILANGPLTVDAISRQMKLAKQSVHQYLNYYRDEFERFTEEGKVLWRLRKH